MIQLLDQSENCCQNILILEKEKNRDKIVISLKSIITIKASIISKNITRGSSSLFFLRTVSSLN